MTEIVLLSPMMIALLPGIWSFGNIKRMFWTLMVLLLGPVLVIIPGGMILGAFGLAWRCAVGRWCGLCFVAGIAELFVWFGTFLWKEIPAERWHRMAVWLCRTADLAVVGAACGAFVMYSSLIVLFCADTDHTTQRNGENVVVQYLWHDGYNYYDWFGPVVRGLEMLEGSSGLETEPR